MYRATLAMVLAVLAARSAVAADGPGPTTMKDAPANTWVRIAGSPGARSSFGLVYVSQENAFVCLGGSMAMDSESKNVVVNSPYSELTLNMDGGVWENRFPRGKEGLWGEATGPSKAPKFGGSIYAFTLKDIEGNTRPYLGGGYYNGAWNWGNYAYDPDRGKVLLYWTLAEEARKPAMAEYSLAGRVWTTMPDMPNQPQEFRDGMLFGSMCYEAVNKEIIGGQFEWACKDGVWKRLSFGSELINGLRAKADALRIRARNLTGACRARYYIAESDAEAKINLAEVTAALVKDVKVFAEEIKSSAANAQGYEKTQLGWVGESLAAAVESLNKVAAALAGKVTPEAIQAADAAREDMQRAVLALAVCPPKRAHARMVYDEKNKKLVLFGGYTLDRVLADTWVYDPTTRRWEQQRPRLSPSPRYSHKLAYLPRSGKVLMFGGQGYTVKPNTEMWVYDLAANQWQLLTETCPQISDAWYPTPAAAGPDDVVVAFAVTLPAKDLVTVAARIDAARVDREKTDKLGVPPLTESLQGGAEEPQWYEKNAPPPDPAAEDEWFKTLPTNTWTARKVPNWPKTDRCWGTSALDIDRDQILQFGGGHATYDGNNVLHYSIRANRFYIGHYSEHALNFGPYGAGIRSSKTYQNRPFCNTHGYK